MICLLGLQPSKKGLIQTGKRTRKYVVKFFLPRAFEGVVDHLFCTSHERSEGRTLSAISIPSHMVNCVRFVNLCDDDWMT